MSQSISLKEKIAQRPYIVAIIIALLLVAWMMSGPSQEEQKANIPEKQEKKAPTPRVKVETLIAQPVSNTVELYGRTEPDRVTTLKAEVDGRVERVIAKRGTPVKKGQVIAELAINDLDAQLKQAKALLIQKELEFEGTQSLNKDGYQGQVQLTRAEAELEAVRADIKRLEINLENKVIRAPFSGILNTRYVEEGDFVKRGDRVAMIADLNPLVVRAFATESQVSDLQIGQIAHINLLNKAKVEGEIRYIASVADENTNTFKLEVKIQNPDNKLVAGISSQVEIPLASEPAIKITPALLALDEQGNIGIKTVEGNTVKFTDIKVVKTESDGVWLGGLGAQADVITLGQGFVRDGDTVEPVRGE